MAKTSKRIVKIDNENVTVIENKTEDITQGAQTMRIKHSNGYRDYFGQAVSNFERTLRQAAWEEKHPERKHLSITEKLILEGQKRREQRERQNKTRVEEKPMFSINSREYLDNVLENKSRK